MFTPQIPERISTNIPDNGRRATQLVEHKPAKIQKTTTPATVKRATKPTPVKVPWMERIAKEIRDTYTTTAAKSEADIVRLSQRIQQIDIDINMLLKADRSQNATAIANLKRERLDILQRIEKLKDIYQDSLKKAANA
jgi:hypothetical protein